MTWQGFTVGRVLPLVGIFVMLSLAMACANRRPVVAPLPPLTAPLAPSDFSVAEPPEYQEEYRLLPGDVLRVKFPYHSELDLKVPVRADGRVALVDIGVFRAEGRTAEDLAQEIQDVSSEFLREPSVTVIVAELGPHRVFVGGQVRNPGYVPYRSGMTPLQAILDRGGFTDTAQIDSVLKVSSYRKGPAQATRLDFSGTIKVGGPEFNTLGAYDVLYVPPTFIGDVNTFVRLYVRNLIPIPFRTGVGLTP